MREAECMRCVGLWNPVLHTGMQSLAVWFAAAFMAGTTAAAEVPLIVPPEPPTESGSAVSVRMGDVTFTVPRKLYGLFSGRRPQRQDEVLFDLELSLTPLERASPASPHWLHVEVAYDPYPFGTSNQIIRQQMLSRSDLSTKRTDEYGFTVYKNRGGEMFEKENERGEWFAMECSPNSFALFGGWPPLCSRNTLYSEHVRLTYSYPRTYLPRPLEIEASLFRILDALKAS